MENVSFSQLLITAILSSAVISTIIGVMFQGYKTRAEARARSQYSWKEQSVSDLLAPRTRRRVHSRAQVNYSLENALFNWEAGIGRLRDLERAGHLRGDAVTGPVREELRRRLGFSIL